MIKKKALYPPLFFFWSTSSSASSSPSTTPDLSPASSSSDTDSDGDMDPADSSVSRPPSLAVPSPAAFSPMRPTLSDVLANAAPPPYTLSSFMAYLSQNHCLETLEFTLEAKRYRESYASLSTRLPPDTTDSDESRHLRMLWDRLLSAYILPGSPREINLPSEVRDGLLALPNEMSPPFPQNLDHAVRLIHELMDESIFLPFLNSHSSLTQTSPDAAQFGGGDEGVRVVSSTGLDDHATRPTRAKSGWKRISPQTSTGDLISPISISASASTSSQSQSQSHPQSPSSSTSTSTRSNFPLPLTAITTLAKPRSSGPPSSSASGDTPSGSVTGALTDDSWSLHSSPSVSVAEPVTPPMTPPGGDLANSPKGRSENPWKKMGLKLGFKRRGASHGE